MQHEHKAVGEPYVHAWCMYGDYDLGKGRGRLLTAVGGSGGPLPRLPAGSDGRSLHRHPCPGAPWKPSYGMHVGSAQEAHVWQGRQLDGWQGALQAAGQQVGEDPPLQAGLAPRTHLGV